MRTTRWDLRRHAAVLAAGLALAASGEAIARPLHAPPLRSDSTSAPADIRTLEPSSGLEQDPAGPERLPPDVESDGAGEALTVYLMTMGPGDAVWERFGHNAIWIRDAAAGTDLTYNYGMFDFEQERFLLRFMRGEMLYWMAAHPAVWTLDAYARQNRSVFGQELALTPGQRAELQEFLAWNERPENREYLYDYYRDNCSTRVRDAIDQVLGGALHRQLATVPTGATYRSHTQRLTEDDLPVWTGLLLALGQPGDQPIDAWQEGFIPMELRDHVRTVRVPDEAGGQTPLVRSERTLYEARREAPAEVPPDRTGPFLVAGLAGAALMLGLGFVAGRSGPARIGLSVLGSGWGVLSGVLGTIILGLWLLTEHSFTYRNENVLQMTPLGLILAVLVPLAVLTPVRSGRTAPARMALALAAGAAALSAAGALLQVLPAFHQVNGPIVALALPLHLGLVGALWLRLRAAPR